MEISEFIKKNDLKRSIIARAIGCPFPTLSAFLNGYGKLPKKYHDDFCKLLGISEEEFSNNKINHTDFSIYNSKEI